VRDWQVYESGYESAGEMLLHMKTQKPTEYAEWHAKARRQMDDPLPQPIHRQVDQLCSFLHEAYAALPKGHMPYDLVTKDQK
jgi:hypothetical protein